MLTEPNMTTKYNCEAKMRIELILLLLNTNSYLVITRPAVAMPASGYYFWARYAWVCASVCGSVRNAKWSDLLSVQTKMCKFPGEYACRASHCRFFV